MPLIAIPNVSEGNDPDRIRAFSSGISGAGARVLDVHSDSAHDRTVFTATAKDEVLVDAMATLAQAATIVDLTASRGAHPRLGCLDVCPFVPHERDMADAVEAARRAGGQIADRAGLPVYLYGEAAARAETRDLPELRRGGLDALIDRADAGLPPDFGPRSIDPRRGVVCVGARRELIAFNVWLEAAPDVARRIAAATRMENAIRALGLDMSGGLSQVSMNLIDPARVGIDDAYERVALAASRYDVRVRATEIVGLVPVRFMPDPDAEAARRLMAPGRSLESALVL